MLVLNTKTREKLTAQVSAAASDAKTALVLMVVALSLAIVSVIVMHRAVARARS